MNPGVLAMFDMLVIAATIYLIAGISSAIICAIGRAEDKKG